MHIVITCSTAVTKALSHDQSLVQDHVKTCYKTWFSASSPWAFFSSVFPLSTGVFLALRLKTNHRTFGQITNGSSKREEVGVGKARAEEEEFHTHTANLQESCSSQFTSAMWGFHELLGMGMIWSLPEMDLDTATRCCAGRTAPDMEKIAAGSSGLTEGDGERAKSIYIKCF